MGMNRERPNHSLPLFGVGEDRHAAGSVLRLKLNGMLHFMRDFMVLFFLRQHMRQSRIPDPRLWNRPKCVQFQLV